MKDKTNELVKRLHPMFPNTYHEIYSITHMGINSGKSEQEIIEDVQYYNTYGKHPKVAYYEKATKVINLVGASGSGKTSIARELEKQGHNVIQSYTTRAARYKDEWGHTFLTEDDGWYEEYVKGTFVGISEIIRESTNSRLEVTQYIDIDDMIAYFNSYNSGNHYFATDDQVLRGKTNIYVVDPKGAEMVHDFYRGTDISVATIYLNVDESVRAERLLARIEDASFSCMFKDNPTECPEVWDRIRPDREIFSIAKCDYSINANGSIEDVVEKVKKVI